MKNQEDNSQTFFLGSTMNVEASKTSFLVDQDEIETAGKLRSIIAEVEANASASVFTNDQATVYPISNTELIKVSKNFKSYDKEDKDSIDLTSRMETIIAAAAMDRNDTRQHRTFNSYISHNTCPVTAYDSNDKQDFDLPNKLYRFIAEATEGMDAEDVCFVPNVGENQHSELSNLVADTMKTLEMGTANNSDCNNKPAETVNCKGIVAVDLEDASIYLSTLDYPNDDSKKDREFNKENGIAAKKKFVCHHCCSEWSNYYMIKSHIVWNHIPELEKKQIYRIVPNLSNVTLINRIFNKLHKFKEGRWKTDTCSSPFTYRIMLKKRKIKYYKCRNCDFKTPKEYDMRKHKTMKHNKLMHQCNYCNYCTTVQSCMQRHIMAKHTKVKPHKCNYCDYSATQYITLQEHVMAKHTFEKPHICPYCDYASVQRNILKDHIRGKHTHERNRKCNHCNYATVSSATLRRHIMAKHTNEKPYKCEFCHYSATQSGQLRKHIMAMHTNEKPFHCPSCSYKATQSYSMKLHIRRKHSIEKPYQCNYCKYKCSTNTYMKYHVQNKHKSDLRKNVDELMG